MRLKKTLFDAMPVPFRLEEGRVGSIRLKIPVWNLFKSPIIIEIVDVSALIRPKPPNDWNEQLEQRDFQRANQSQLEKFELYSQGEELLQSNVERMVAKIVDNVEVTVSNVQLRYEDEDFQMGLGVKEVSMHTVDGEWKAKQSGISEEITHKLFKVK